MNCENIQDKFADYLTGDIDSETRRATQDHIASCETCREEIENLTTIWAKLEVLPVEQPSSALRGKFYSMLEEAKKESRLGKRAEHRGGLFAGWKDWFSFRRPAFVASFSIFLLFVGLGGGWLASSGRDAGARMAALEREIGQIRQTAALSLLSQPSASERLQGISYSTEVEKPDSGILVVLMQTLDSDPNPNVRLAAVDALYLFRNHPGVKDGLVRSLAVQDSPIVQVALIDLLVGIREARAAEALKALIGNEGVNPDVKKRAEDGLKQII